MTHEQSVIEELNALKALGFNPSGKTVQAIASLLAQLSVAVMAFEAADEATKRSALERIQSVTVLLDRRVLDYNGGALRWAKLDKHVAARPAYQKSQAIMQGKTST